MRSDTVAIERPVQKQIGPRQRFVGVGFGVGFGVGVGDGETGDECGADGDFEGAGAVDLGAVVCPALGVVGPVTNAACDATEEGVVADLRDPGLFTGSTGPMPEPLRPAVELVAAGFEAAVCEVAIALVSPCEFFVISTVTAATTPITRTSIASRIRADHGATAACWPAALVSVSLPSGITHQLSQTDPVEPKPHDARSAVVPCYI